MTECAFCRRPSAHYMTHVCPGCICHHIEVRIPGEPHIPAYLDAEPNPQCPLHGWRVRDD